MIQPVKEVAEPMKDVLARGARRLSTQGPWSKPLRAPGILGNPGRASQSVQMLLSDNPEAFVSQQRQEDGE